MTPARDETSSYTRANGWPPSGGQPEARAGSSDFARRAHLRATESAFDLFEALREGDVTAARWLLDAVYGQVSSLSGAYRSGQ